MRGWKPSWARIWRACSPRWRIAGRTAPGFAVYTAGAADRIKLTVRGPAGTDFSALAARLPGATVVPRDTHAVLSIGVANEAEARRVLAAIAPEIAVVCAGVAHGAVQGSRRAGGGGAAVRALPACAGRTGSGHTRMATESAVTTDRGASLFDWDGPVPRAQRVAVQPQRRAAGAAAARAGVRDRERHRGGGGVSPATGCGGGASLGDALRGSLADLDGFYTFVVGTESGFGVLRDPIACKPAVMAETERYVAFGSEYRALADLPGIEQARVWEPEPATVYFWDRHA